MYWEPIGTGRLPLLGGCQGSIFAGGRLFQTDKLCAPAYGEI